MRSLQAYRLFLRCESMYSHSCRLFCNQQRLRNPFKNTFLEIFGKGKGEFVIGAMYCSVPAHNAGLQSFTPVEEGNRTARENGSKTGFCLFITFKICFLSSRVQKYRNGCSTTEVHKAESDDKKNMS